MNIAMTLYLKTIIFYAAYQESLVKYVVKNTIEKYSPSHFSFMLYNSHNNTKTLEINLKFLNISEK